jgi:hypothetical protein
MATKKIPVILLLCRYLTMATKKIPVDPPNTASGREAEDTSFDDLLARVFVRMRLQVLPAPLVATPMGPTIALLQLVHSELVAIGCC